MITAADVMAGDVPSVPIRLQNLGRILGCSIWRRSELLAWLERHCQYIALPTSGPWSDAPAGSGCWDLQLVSEALRKGKPPECCHYAWGRSIPPADMHITAARASGP